jgi:hypothetical protein
MTKLQEFSQTEDYLKVSRVPKSDIRLLWHSGYWDGIISGLLLFKGEKYWFQMIKEGADIIYNEGNERRIYLIVELSGFELTKLEYWHDLFKEKVGTHTEYDDTGKRAIGALKPKELWDDFYESFAKREKEDFSDNEVIGWFEE